MHPSLFFLYVLYQCSSLSAAERMRAAQRKADIEKWERESGNQFPAP